MARIYAHRGASGYAPENTIAAFDLALNMPVDGIETDIRASREGALVLLHDATVDRTTDGRGAVADLSLAELRQLDAGVRFAPRFAGQRVPTLDELLDRYAGRTRFWLEVKAPGVEEPLARAVRERGLGRDVQFSSFQFDSLRRLRAAWPEAELTFLTRELEADTLDRCRGLGVAQLSLHHSALGAAAIGRIRAAGLEARAWGIGDKAALRRVLDLGVSGLTLNWPDWVQELGATGSGTQP